MLKKLMLLLCLGAFIAVAAIGGCGGGAKTSEETPATDETSPE
jgi:hypothetical protein